MSLLLSARETLHFQNKAGRLFYNSLGYVHMMWDGAPISQAELETYYEQALLLMKRTQAHRVLSAHSARQPLTAQAQDWIAKDWIPRAIQQAAFAYCAIVDGGNPIHRLATQSVIFNSPAQLQYRRFLLLGEAQAWLKTTLAN